MAASRGLLNRVPGAGTFPPGRYTSAELGQWSRNISATPAMAPLIAGTRG